MNATARLPAVGADVSHPPGARKDALAGRENIKNLSMPEQPTGVVTPNFQLPGAQQYRHRHPDAGDS